MARLGLTRTLVAAFCSLSVTLAAPLGENVEGRVAEQPGAERVLHFPAERSLGTLKDLDTGLREDGSAPMEWWWGYAPGRDFGEARGEVRVPAETRLGLVVSREGQWDLSPLADVAPGVIESLWVRCERAPDVPGDDLLASICKLAGLKSLYLDNTGVTNAGLARLGRLESLERLAVLQKGLDEAGVAHIAKVRTLRTLRMSTDTKFSAETLSRLEQLTSLQELFLAWRGLEADAYPCLGRLPSLQYLSLGGSGHGAEGLGQLAGMPALRRLYVADLTDAELAALPDLASLGELEFVGEGGKEYEYTAAGLGNLSRFAKLESLTIHGRYQDGALVGMQPMPSLRRLSLQGLWQDRDYITDKSLAHVSTFQSLESLDIFTGRFTDAGLECLAQLQNLKRLHIANNSGFTDAGLEHVAKLRHLEELYLRGELLTDVGMKRIAEMVNLRSLRFLELDEVTDEGFSALAALKDLRVLEFLTAPKVTVFGLNALNGLTNLTQLRTEHIAASDSVLNIAGLAQLETLRITGLRDEDLACLAQLKRLRSLRISGSITDAGLKHLEGLVALETLEIRGPSEVTEKGIALLKEKVPGLHVEERRESVQE